jgi:hypothetical protein
MPETILETPDSVARAAKQFEQAQAEGGPLGEKLTLNMGPSHPSSTAKSSPAPCPTSAISIAATKK